MNAIEMTHVCKRYTDFALDDINLCLPSGSIMGLVGENGAGKSTTLQLIMNAVSCDGGEIKVLGVQNKADGFQQTKEEIGVVLDEAYFPEVLTPLQVGAIMRRTYRKWESSRFLRYLEQFKLPPKKEFKDFSRGMKMKLAI